MLKKSLYLRKVYTSEKFILEKSLYLRKVYRRWKKYIEIQLTINKMDLNNRKMKNRPPSPADLF